MAHLITLIPGDGIGPEVAAATVRAVDATGAAIEWEPVQAGLRALTEQGQLIPDDVFASLEMTRVGLKGPTTTPMLNRPTGSPTTSAPLSKCRASASRAPPPRPSAADTRASTWCSARSSVCTPTFARCACCPDSKRAKIGRAHV